MKILKIDDEVYKVLGDTLEVNDKLPAEVFTVCFAKMQGFFLKKHPKLQVTEKLYGSHEKKINKLMNSWDHFERSMGVIFSGDKGMGKSIAARMLCEKSNAKGLPVILVEENIPGIAQFIDTIQQECLVLFDEFEKNFNKREDEDVSSQDSLLSLFDGTGSGIKRMYIITCNDIYQLSDFLVNRPGRFHYHIRWEYPTEDDIREYLMDNIKPEYHKEIDVVLSFTSLHNLNYDCLRAIAFEINMGIPFTEAICDLNIVNIEDTIYNCEVVMKNGYVFKGFRTINIINDTQYVISLIGQDNMYEFTIYINNAKIKFNNGIINIDPKYAKVGNVYTRKTDENDPFNKGDLDVVRNNIKSITLKRETNKNYYNYHDFENFLA